MKLSDDNEPRLEAASEPRLDAREPRLLPEEQDNVLADKLKGGREREREQKESGERTDKSGIASVRAGGVHLNVTRTLFSFNGNSADHIVSILKFNNKF